MDRIATLPDDTSPRHRILDAAFSLALEGGLSMREVAARASVSTRTLHQLFPSKNVLLLSALIERAVSTDFFPETTSGDAPLKRVLEAFRHPTEALLELPQVAAGLMKALVAPDEQAIPLLRTYRDGVLDRALRALSSGEPTLRDREIARALSQVWFAATAGWVTGAESAGSVMESVEAAARLMVED